jgi:hypothetical protein
LRGAALDVYVGEFEHTPMSRLWSDTRRRATCAVLLRRSGDLGLAESEHDLLRESIQVFQLDRRASPDRILF